MTKTHPASTPPALLTPAQIAFMNNGASVVVSACGADGRPSLMRALACNVPRDGRSICIYLAPSRAGRLLEDLRATGRIAAVFSSPQTHQTLQVKAASASTRELQTSDLQALRRGLRLFAGQLVSGGYSPELSRVMTQCRPEDLMAVCFTPEHAFDQTPGPGAGAPLVPIEGTATLATSTGKGRAQPATPKRVR